MVILMLFLVLKIMPNQTFPWESWTKRNFLECVSIHIMKCRRNKRGRSKVCVINDTSHIRDGMNWAFINFKNLWRFLKINNKIVNYELETGKIKNVRGTKI